MPPLTREQFYERHGSLLTQASERLFVDDFLWPLLGERIGLISPQHPFLDSAGRNRRIDFAFVDGSTKLAFEVNGETYHAEGIIPDALFDDNLFRQNEILRDGYRLIRFSYGMLQAPRWRPQVMESLRSFITLHAPALLGEHPVKPNPLQADALQALDFYRSRGWRKGIVILPTGTGKTIMSALDAKRMGGRALFLVHRLDILKQSVEAYRKVWPNMIAGLLTGEAREREHDCDVLFASKDTLRQPTELARFTPDAFDYMVVDEVHHGQTPTYQDILSYFQPEFTLGMTATPDRMDRKDIFELFDYNKVFEVSLQEAIEDGYLVPYTYSGLLDNVDYSRIRYQNNRYRVDDLERLLIIPERNQAILREYLSRGSGDKAIGFCVSIAHAERMASFFRDAGVPAEAVTSTSVDRDRLIERFRGNDFNVAFTVDLFNEGVDFPNVRVLMFLRPTESRTVFLQQVGRGLRLCTGKERVVVLDFIGNYERANQARKWLAKVTTTKTETQDGRLRKKILYEYSTGCEVLFDPSVEEILDRQDEGEIAASKEDLKEAYFLLAESLGRKPARDDIDAHGQYKVHLYTRLFGSWLRFLQEIGEYTEASYHYPQGVHLGHILAILKAFGGDGRSRSAFADKYIRMRGGYDQGRLGAYQRQIKYKLQAAMELGLLSDDRKATAASYVPELTALGRQVYDELFPLLHSLDLHFALDEDRVPSTRMALDDRQYNEVIADFLSKNAKVRKLFLQVFLGMPAVQQMLSFLYQVGRKRELTRPEIYENFFQAPLVKQFCDQEGIEEATEEAARHRCPFLLNVLEACSIVKLETRQVSVEKFLIAGFVVRSHRREALEDAEKRAARLKEAWPSSKTKPRTHLVKETPHLLASLDTADVSILRELFGSNFLTPAYHLTSAEYMPLA